MNIVYGAASMLGAALGGAMADYLGWRWEFGVQVPFVAACLVVAVLVVPDDLGLAGREKQTLREALRTFDFQGSVLLSSSVTFLILGLVGGVLSRGRISVDTSQNLGGNVLPWCHPFVIASLAMFAVLFPLCLLTETRAAKPIMPLRFFLKSPYSNLMFSNHIAAFLGTATLFNV
jgi:MFS family permease